MKAAVERLLEQGVAEGIFPGAVAAVVDRSGGRTVWVVGRRMVVPLSRPMERETVFDLASLTKPLVTAPLTLLLAQEGRLDLDESIAAYLPAFRRSEVTVRHLLTHTSGLPAWLPLYRHLDRPEKVIEYLGQVEPVCPVGTRIVYSCLGYILLGKLLETLTEERLDRLAERRLFGPLGMVETGFCPPPNRQERCAATETADSAAKRHAPYPSYRRNRPVLCGEVHDENAAFLGGVAGNAGLFAPIDDLIRYAECLLDAGQPIFPKVVYRALFAVAHQDGTTRRSLAWIVRDDGICTHTGFTGTAWWWDPQRGRVAILLTNRIHPDATGTGIAEIRQQFARLTVGESGSS